MTNDNKINKAKQSLKEDIMRDKTQILFEKYFIQTLLEEKPGWLSTLDKAATKIATGVEKKTKEIGLAPSDEEIKAGQEKLKDFSDKINKRLQDNPLSKEMNTAIRNQIEKETGRPADEVMRDLEKALKKKPESIFSNPLFFKIIAVSVIVAALSVAAYKVYKHYFSKAAKACQGKSGAEKDRCMKLYRIAALTKARDVLKKQASNCSKSRDPQQCKSKIIAKVAKFDQKINKAKSSLREGEIMLDKYLNDIQQESVGAAIGKAAGLASKYGMLIYTVPFIIGLATKPMKAMFDKAEKACKGLAPEDYAKCKKKYKIQGVQAAISKLNSEKSKCAKTKNPQECQQKIAAKMNQLKGKLSAIQG
jgi:hypothetical protein